MNGEQSARPHLDAAHHKTRNAFSQAGEPHLIFRLEHTWYALRAANVREIHLLPELTPLDEAPPFMLGAVNLRGEVLPVMDLARRLGRGALRIELNDSLMVLEAEGFRFGLRVSEVLRVTTLAASQLQMMPLLQEQSANSAAETVLSGVVEVDGRIVTVLRSSALLNAEVNGADFNVVRALEAENATALADVAAPPTTFDDGSFGPTLFGPTVFAPHATAAEMAVFHARAERLRQRVDTEAEENTFPVAVLHLGGETFGVALHQVQEFCHLHAPTPVPCCPPHILGQMNLRGEVLTLIDVRELLRVGQNISVQQTSAPNSENRGASQVVVVQHAQSLTGIVVDEVVDVLYLRPEQLRDESPEAVALQNGGRQFFIAGALYGERMLYLLDVPKLVGAEELIVDKHV